MRIRSGAACFWLPESTSWVFTWKVWRSNVDSCWPGQVRLWACITWLTGRSSSCTQTSPRTNQHVPGELTLLQMHASSRCFPHPSPLFSAHLIVRGMKVCCRTFFRTADVRHLNQSDQSFILVLYWKYNVSKPPQTSTFLAVWITDRKSQNTFSDIERISSV